MKIMALQARVFLSFILCIAIQQNLFASKTTVPYIQIKLIKVESSKGTDFQHGLAFLFNDGTYKIQILAPDSNEIMTHISGQTTGPASDIRLIQTSQGYEGVALASDGSEIYVLHPPHITGLLYPPKNSNVEPGYGRHIALSKDGDLLALTTGSSGQFLSLYTGLSTGFFQKQNQQNDQAINLHIASLRSWPLTPPDISPPLLTAVAIAPDKSFVVVGTLDGDVIISTMGLRDTHLHLPMVGQMRLHHSAIGSVAIVEHSHSVVAMSYDRLVAYSLENYDPMHVWTPDTGSTGGWGHHLDVSADGTKVLAIDTKNQVHVYDVISGAQLALLEGETHQHGALRSALFTASGSHVRFLYEDGTATLQYLHDARSFAGILYNISRFITSTHKAAVGHPYRISQLRKIEAGFWLDELKRFSKIYVNLTSAQQKLVKTFFLHLHQDSPFWLNLRMQVSAENIARYVQELEYWLVRMGAVTVCAGALQEHPPVKSSQP